MRKALLYIGIALAAIGCTKELDDDTPLDDNALTITSNITTRVADGDWEKNDPIGVYMTTETLGDEGANVKYTTADGDGAFTSTSPLYLPLSGDGVSIFAYYPYDESVSLTAYSITSSEQVDILSATNDDVSSSNVALTFDHLLSKVSLTIKAGDGVSLIDLADLAVTISGIGTKTAGFNLTNPTAVVTFSESTALRFKTTTTKDSNGFVTAISSSAIVIPQTLSYATLIFTTTNGDKYSATIPVKAFVTGLEYSYTITIKKSEVTISSATINKWDNGDETSGTADIVDIEYKSSDETYHINSGAGLKAFADLVNGVVNTTATSASVNFSETPQLSIKGVLTRNIDLSTVCGADIGADGASVNWTPIGGLSSCKFAGTFNGGGYEISGLYIGSGSKLGLFGYLDENGLVNNVGVKGDITTTSAESAGIVSYNDGWVMNSYSEVTLSGGINSAGIAGYNIGNVVNCYNRGDVKGTNNVGGIVGQNAAGGYVGYCFSVGDIDGTLRVGGIVGWNHTTTSTAPTIKGCFCLDLEGEDYSIGQLEYALSSGTFSGNMYNSEYLASEVFANLMNNGASTYNTNKDDAGNQAHTESPVNACAWKDNSESDYPTLNVSDTEPLYNSKVYDIIYNGGIYEIYTAEGLKAFAYLVNGVSIKENLVSLVSSGNYDSYFDVEEALPSINGQLMNDIDLSTVCSESNSITWTRIGCAAASYSGTFNGNGKVVSNLYVSFLGTAGLFGYTSSPAQISNLGVKGVVSGSIIAGGVVGNNGFGSTITNCYSSCIMVSNGGTAGGVVGENYGNIINCYNSGSVNGNSFSKIGGVVGKNSGSLENCYNSAVVGTGTSAGGVVGSNESSGTITSCYWDSNVCSHNGVGDDLNSSSTTATGYDGSEKNMKDVTFVTLLNSNAYTYNSGDNTPTVKACAWKAVTNDYPTLSFGADPGVTYSKLSDFSAESYPVGDVWYITDETASVDIGTNDFGGLMAALGVANTSRNITVIFPNLVTLPSMAFENCTCLTSISLPRATSIGERAFVGCTSLTSLELPSATEIGKNAFYGCTALTTLNLGSSGSGVGSIGEKAFNEDADTTIAGDIDLTIKISGDGVSVSGNTLTYNTSETATFKSITVITNWALND